MEYVMLHLIFIYLMPGEGQPAAHGDMEYVMLHLIFIYLMPGEGQPAAHAASDL